MKFKYLIIDEYDGIFGTNSGDDAVMADEDNTVIDLERMEFLPSRDPITEWIPPKDKDDEDEDGD